MGVLSKQCCFFEATCHKSAQGSPYLLWIFFSNLSQRLVSHGFSYGFSHGFSPGFPLKQTVTRRNLDALGPIGPPGACITSSSPVARHLPPSSSRVSKRPVPSKDRYFLGASNIHYYW